MSAPFTDRDRLAINVIRGLSLDAVEKAKSGHAGLPLGAAPMACVLWSRHLKFDPADPKWFDRDRFVLSAGHGSMLLYALLHLSGYALPIDELKRFRQLHSMTPGHPENLYAPGVEMATGPLGQGVAHTVGMAIAERYLASHHPGHVDHYTYSICSDGDLMEGVSQEAASLAGHLKLGKLIWLYDDNGITIDGPTSLAFTEDVGARFEAYGWHVEEIDGMDLAAVDAALTRAKADDRPSLIRAKTIIGYGSPKLAGTSKAHSNPFGAEELALTKRELGLPEESFYAPQEAYDAFAEARERGQRAHADWDSALPQDDLLRKLIEGPLTLDWKAVLPVVKDKIATRKASEGVINALASHHPGLIGGSADLAESNLTDQKGYGSQSAENPGGRNIHFGVREHAMVAAVNGITLHGATRGYGGSFLIFSDYARPSQRLAALMECPSVYVFTHDSVGVGEDGPTHEPIEQLTALRAIPNFNVFRPADGNETAAAWKVALQSTETPTLLALSRQALPAVTPEDVANHPAEQGAYVLSGDEEPQIILIGTGSEVSVAVGAKEQLAQQGVRASVVSMPSWFLFERQSAEYRESVLPKGTPKVSVEAGSTLAWPRYSDAQVGIDRFGMSAPGDQVMRELGITAEHVVEVALKLLKDGDGAPGVRSEHGTQLKQGSEATAR